MDVGRMSVLRRRTQVPSTDEKAKWIGADTDSADTQIINWRLGYLDTRNPFSSLLPAEANPLTKVTNKCLRAPRYQVPCGQLATRRSSRTAI